ncbi:unnamed protein product [Blepharisma stoltei]|uniref:non-specific serine/threonine protein kinase n=1 Tax=Blepharisma stoltei TaxID=1481888 RepID=A0AAU9IV95_9CILI|nr:unnamed protein product [Blepharisma stoltei]
MSQIVIKKQWLVSSRTVDIMTCYSFEKEIGSGAYGKVFQAKDINSGILRAVKVIQKNRVKDYGTFCNEINILKTLDHPNVVNVIETFETGRLCFLVLELCQGGELFTRITALRILSERQAALIMKNLFSAIMYCHDNSICHRDIKPENCLFVDTNTESELKLIDFGISKMLTEVEVMHAIDGTPYYMAPEILTGSYTKQVDCWSLGVILYIMLGGSPPFNGKDNQEIMMNVYNGYWSFRPKAFATVSDHAKDLIARLLVKDPDIRWTAKQAYHHPWIQGLAPTPQYPLVPEVFDGIQSFSHAQKLKRVTLTFIASKLSEKDIENLKKIFKSLNISGDGTITRAELHQGMRMSGVDIDSNTLETTFSILDSNRNGKIDYTEFLAACLYNQSTLDQGLLKTAFQHFDHDRSGFITNDELKEVLTGGDVSVLISDNDIQEIMRETDRNGDGRIDYMEFLAMMNRV